MKYLSITVLICGLLLTGAGIFFGDAVKIMQQAITVCLECVGIG